MSKNFRRSYSQFCEDILIEGYLGRKNSVTYIDIGCLWPINLSNTYLFYQNDGSGLCIDPNPTIADEYRSTRPRDVFINTGVSNSASSLRYSMFENPVFNTFDQARRDKVVGKGKPGRALIGEVSIPVRPLSDILGEVDWWSRHKRTDVLCLDVEGHELDVLASAQLDRLRPTLIVCELIGGMEAVSSHPIVKFLEGAGYGVRGYTGHDVFMLRNAIEDHG